MDWLRSENLKEEKNVTAPIAMIAGKGSIVLWGWRGVREAYHWSMRRFHLQYPASDACDRWVAADVLVREEPDEEEEDEEDDGKDGDDDDGDGYSE